MSLGAGPARRRRTARWRSPAAMSVPISRPGARPLSVCKQKARVVFTATIAGQAYARHGTTMETRLTVIDRVAGRRSALVSALARNGRQCIRTPRPDLPPGPGAPADRGTRSLRPRPVAAAMSSARCSGHASEKPQLDAQLEFSGRPAPAPDVVELAYETCDWTPGETPVHREPLRRLRAAIDPHCGCATAPDETRAVGGHGGGRPAPSRLPPASAAPAALGRRSCPTRSSRA